MNHTPLSRLSLIAAVLASIVISLTACNTVPNIGNDLEPKEYFLKAQEAVVERSDYRTAKAYYEAFLEHHSDDLQLTTEAEYEIAFIDYKLGDYASAKAGFEALLRKYESDIGGLLPTWPLILSRTMLEKISDTAGGSATAAE